MSYMKKPSVVIGNQAPAAALPPRDIDGIFSEFTHFEWLLFMLSLISASICSNMGARLYIGVSIWCGIGAIMLSLHFRFKSRRAAMEKLSKSKNLLSDPPQAEEIEEQEEFEESFEDGSFLDATTVGAYPKDRNMSIPINCIKILEAKATSSYAEYRIVITLDGTSADGSAAVSPTSSTVPIQWEVWRRYSEFSGLRARLRSCNLMTSKGAPSGWSPPSLPAKSLRRHLDQKYLKERRGQLEKFLLVLLYHPLIRRSEEMRAFLCFGTRKTSPSVLPSLTEESMELSKHSSTHGASKTVEVQPDKQPDIQPQPPTPEEMDKLMEQFCWEGNQPNIDGQWRDASSAHDFQLRGQLYMDDKVKQHTGDAVMRFLCCRVYRCRKEIDGDRLDHIATKGTFGKMMSKLQEMSTPYREPNEPIFFIVNIQIPGTPVVHVVQVFALPLAYEKRFPGSSDAKFRHMFKQYYEDLPVWEGGEAESSITASPDLGVCPLTHFRNQRFKLVPKVVDGPWMVKKTIPSKPALLGQKLTQRYFRGECYVETDIHVGSSVVANNITGVGRRASNSLHIDMGYALEGRAEDELPERLLGCGRFTNLNVTGCCTIEE